MKRISAWKNECPYCLKKISGASVRRKICEHCSAMFGYPAMRYVMAIFTILAVFLMISVLVKSCDGGRNANNDQSERGSSILWKMAHSGDKPSGENVDVIYIDRIYSDDSKYIYRIMKANELLPDKEGSDKSKLSAIIISGMVSAGDDPCFDGKNQAKCLDAIKNQLSSDKYKNDMDKLLPLVKPIPPATDAERKKTAHEEGRPMCEDAVLRMVSIPSTVSFSWGSAVTAYADGTFELLGKFTHKNAYGQQLKKEYGCEITLTKMGRTIRTVKITSMTESY